MSGCRIAQARGWAGRVVIVAVMVMGVCALPAPAAALADSMGVTVSNSSPSIGTPISVAVNTNASPINSYGDGPYLYATVQPSSAGGCQPTYGDNAQVVGSQATELAASREVPTGSASQTFNATEYAPGTYVVCTWLEDTSNDYAGSSATTADVLAQASAGFQAFDTDTLSDGLSTAAPRPHIPFTVEFTGNATPIDQSGDGPYLFALVQPVSAGGCQATFGADMQVVGSQASELTSANQVTTGRFTAVFNFSAPRGAYRVCAWLEDTSQDYAGANATVSDVLAATGPATFQVGAPPLPPPPACVVPGYRGATLSTIERRLRGAHCSVGRIRWVRNRHVRRNHVIRLSSSPGVRLPHGSHVNITVSRG